MIESLNTLKLPSGPVWERRDGKLFCKVPDCMKRATPFKAMQGLANHLGRTHRITLEGKPWSPPSKKPVEPPPPPPNVNVRHLLTGTDLALITQGISAIQRAKDNLQGRLSEMAELRAKAERLDSIVTAMRQLVPGAF